MDEPCRIRPARAADARAVAAIEARVFADPWSADSLAEAIAGPSTFVLVAEGVGHDVGTMLGYFVGRAMTDEGEVLNLAVPPEAEGRGIGSRLLARGLEALGRRGARTAYLEVRASNARAQQLYERAGFARVGRRRGYYRDPVEDALVLRKALP
ncbi:MAG: ribosomal protein S18-alanine N-acetyltransferase [Gemmatimonadales bacterium]|nr:ribosomal protein S18-alanine N-acetyltransferase [Gemmatimonadales bacterium]